MSRAHDAQKPSSPFGGGSSPFRTFFHRSSALSPKLRALLLAFEHTLEERFKALMPMPHGSHSSDVLTLSWMTSAVESLSRTHVDVKSLINDLEFPLPHWDDHWLVDMYLDNTVKLLDMCIAISSDVSRLDQGQLFLQYALHSLDPPDDGSQEPEPQQVQAAARTLREWVQHVGSGSPKLVLENALPILQDLMASLQPGAPPSSSSKPKSSAKAKVLMQAMYGVKVQTVFVCGVLAAALSGSEATLLDLQVPHKFLWSPAFRDLRAAVYAEFRRAAPGRSGAVAVHLRDFETVYASTEKLLAVLTTCSNNETEQSRTDAPGAASTVLKECILQLRECTGRLSSGMDKLSKQLTGFFDIVLTGRDALLCNLRMPEGDVK